MHWADLQQRTGVRDLVRLHVGKNVVQHFRQAGKIKMAVRINEHCSSMAEQLPI